MPDKTSDLVLIGDSAFAEVAHEYFEAYTEYRVVAFAVEQAYLTRDRLQDLPVVPFETLHETHPPATHHVHVAVVYTLLNRLRARLVEAARARGYPLASFVSPQAFIAPSAEIGEHCFIFENNVVQSHVSIGRNVVLWSGNHIGHHSRIADNVFISSHVVISGLCSVGANSFLGVNSALADRTVLAEDCWVGPGVTLSRSTEVGQMFRAAEAVPSRVDTRRFFRLRGEAPEKP
ncbi:acetyltransferase [Sabulicella rubraurantiaca]|uniref:acetyltransferase n=1 Tax=Sabulicella rubraurantiaca TaxID=2811429 RepID=UPI001A957F76|nr:acetyltransferase [Sabulicella rubraurantiaca]